MNKKLSLNKEVIATLNDDSMNRVQGGAVMVTFTYSCTCAGPACGDSGTCTWPCSKSACGDDVVAKEQQQVDDK